MLGLIIKDLFSLRKFGRSILTIFLVIVIFSFVSKSQAYIIGMTTFFFAMATITSFANDGLSKWDKFALTMPITRTDLVLSKYLLTLILLVSGCIFSIIISIAISLFAKIALNLSIFYIVLAVLFVAMLYMGTMIPLIFKFGVEKSRLISVVLFAIPIMILYLFKNFGFNMPAGNQIAALAISFSIFTVLYFIGSFYLSNYIYKNKDI